MSKKSIILSFFLMLILLASQVYASVNASVIAKLSTSNPKVKQGDEIQVDLYLSDFKYEGRGVDEIVIKLDIDEKVIEDVTVDNIITENGSIKLGNNTLKVEDVNSATEDQVIFSDLTTDCDYKIFIDLKNAYTIENFEDNAKIISIKYKVKDDATIGEVKEAVKYSVDLSQQVTAADMQNGFSNYKVTALVDTVPLTVDKKVDDNTTEKPGNNVSDKEDNSTSDKKDEDTSDKKDENTSDKKDENTSDKKDEDTSDKKDENTSDKKDENTSDKKDENTSDKKDEDTSDKKDENTSNNNGTTGNSQNSGNSNSLNNGTVSGIKPNSTTATSALPAAGLKTIIVPIIILAGVVFFFYKKCEEYKDIK